MRLTSRCLGPVGRPLAAALLASLVALAARADVLEPRLADLLALRPGSTVADVGAGDGAQSVLLARAVGDAGRVYATEIGSEERDEIRATAREAGVANVTVVEAGVAETGLPDACCDAILLRHVYHHLTQPTEIDAGLFRALRPGGRLVVIDFPPTWFLRPFQPEGVSASRSGHGITPEAALAELHAAGFETVEVLPAWEERWLADPTFALVLRKPESSAR